MDGESERTREREDIQTKTWEKEMARKWASLTQQIFSINSLSGQFWSMSKKFTPSIPKWLSTLNVMYS